MTPLLKLQEPGAPVGLLEALLEACDGANRGGGIFSWTTVEGARLFLDADSFKAFAADAEFRLIIGVDSITDEPALEAVASRAEELPGLTAQVLVHDLRPVLFHPKLSWFIDGDRLTLIVGSGNLTRGGLRTNWEAFTVIELDGDEASTAEAEIDGWIASWETVLFELDDPLVLERARDNSGRERSLKRGARRRRMAPDEREADERQGEGVEPAHGDEDVLIATIGGGHRWTQANFPRRIYEGFFRAKVGTKRHVLFQPVSGAGELDALQSRESVEVPSENYRFELTSVSGATYPDGDDRPLGVFLRAGDGVIRYVVLMPDDAGYAPVANLLTSKWDGPTRELPRVLTTADDLRAAWPESPLWNPE